MVNYKEKYELASNLREWLADLSYKDWSYVIWCEKGGYFLQIIFNADCGCGRDEVYQHWCRKWRLSPNITKSEFVQTAFKATLDAEEHEVRELFKYKDAAVFGPHFDVENRVKEYEDREFDMRQNSFKVQDNEQRDYSLGFFETTE